MSKRPVALEHFTGYLQMTKNWYKKPQRLKHLMDIVRDAFMVETLMFLLRNEKKTFLRKQEKCITVTANKDDGIKSGSGSI